ncbi:MAG: hypothetical protein WBB55_11595 [Anaerolineales bacterium]
MGSFSAVDSIAAVASVKVEVVFSSGVESSVAADSGNVDVVFSSGVGTSVVVAPGLLGEHPYTIKIAKMNKNTILLFLSIGDIPLIIMNLSLCLYWIY